MMFFEGITVRKRLPQALDYFEIALKEQYQPTLDYLVPIFANESDTKTPFLILDRITHYISYDPKISSAALTFLTKMANQGSVKDILFLWQAYRDGHTFLGIKKDPSKSWDYLKLAGTLGDIPSRILFLKTAFCGHDFYEIEKDSSTGFVSFIELLPTLNAKLTHSDNYVEDGKSICTGIIDIATTLDRKGEKENAKLILDALYEELALTLQKLPENHLHFRFICDMLVQRANTLDSSGDKNGAEQIIANLLTLAFRMCFTCGRNITSFDQAQNNSVAILESLDKSPLIHNVFQFEYHGLRNVWPRLSSDRPIYAERPYLSLIYFFMTNACTDHKLATYFLGIIYAEGHVENTEMSEANIQRNPMMALTCYKQSADLGFEPASVALHEIITNTLPTFNNYQLSTLYKSGVLDEPLNYSAQTPKTAAWQLLNLAANENPPSLQAQLELAKAYLDITIYYEITPDPAQGLSLLTDLVYCDVNRILSETDKESIGEAAFILAKIGEQKKNLSNFVNKGSPAKVASQCLHVAANLGHAQSLLRLGKAYLDGNDVFLGIGRDVPLAIKYLELVARQGLQWDATHSVKKAAIEAASILSAKYQKGFEVGMFDPRLFLANPDEAKKYDLITKKIGSFLGNLNPARLT